MSEFIKNIKLCTKKSVKKLSTQNKHFSKEAQMANKYKICNIYKAHV